MHTAVTYRAPAPWRRMKSTVAASARASTTPAPPTTQTRSSGGAPSKVQVGTMPRPRSLTTGCIPLATTWTPTPGNRLGTAGEGGVPSRLSTSNGPVKSSWVIPGKTTNPTLKSGMSPLPLAAPVPVILTQS